MSMYYLSLFLVTVDLRGVSITLTYICCEGGQYLSHTPLLGGKVPPYEGSPVIFACTSTLNIV